MFPSLDRYHADAVQTLTTTGEELDDLYELYHLDNDLSDVCNIITSNPNSPYV